MISRNEREKIGAAMSSARKGKEEERSEGDVESVRAQIELAEFVLLLVDSLSKETVELVQRQLDGTVWDEATAAVVGRDEVVRSKMVDFAKAVRCCLESAREAKRTQAMSVHRARLVCSVTLDDANGPVYLHQEARHVKVWRLLNSGTTRWPVECHFVQVAGEPCWDERSRRLSCTEVLSGEEGDMSVVVKTPGKTGVFETQWMLVDGESKPMLDEPLKWSFSVDPSESGQSPPKEGPPRFEELARLRVQVSHVPSVPEGKGMETKCPDEKKKKEEQVDVSKLTESEKVLFDAGLTNMNTIRALLAQNNGDASKVLGEAVL